MKKPDTNMDYVEVYAQKIKDDNRLFQQQKKIIESQLRSSSSFFRNMFAGQDFKQSSRMYLKSVGLLV